MGPSRNSAFVPVLRPWTLDRAPVRGLLRASFESALDRLDLDVTLDIGAGQQPWRQHVEQANGRYVSVDLGQYPDSPVPDLIWDGTRLPVRDHSVTTVLLTEVLEHVPEPTALLREVHRVMHPRGSLYYTVPFLWPVHDAPHDEARYTPFHLQRMLDQCDLVSVDMWALGGWDASLAQLLGLWARRRPMHAVARRVASVLLYPIVGALLRRDRPLDLSGNGMFTGLGGIASPQRARSQP